jgi:hypothetical protein
MIDRIATAFIHGIRSMLRSFRFSNAGADAPAAENAGRIFAGTG